MHFIKKERIVYNVRILGTDNLVSKSGNEYS